MVHLSIEGICGSGKSTVGGLLEKPPLRFRLLKGLNSSTNVKFFPENVANPYLKFFYDKSLRSQYAFFSQSFFLHARVLNYLNIANFNGVALEDRSIFGDYLFAKNLYIRNEMSRELFETYQREKDELMKCFNIREPDGIIFLRTPRSVCIQRMMERGTGEDLDESYWRDLINLYNEEFNDLAKRIPVITIDASINFFKDRKYVGNIADKANELIKSKMNPGVAAALPGIFEEPEEELWKREKEIAVI